MKNIDRTRGGLKIKYKAGHAGATADGQSYASVCQDRLRPSKRTGALQLAAGQMQNQHFCTDADAGHRK